MIYIKYFLPSDAVSLWSYSLISITVSLVIGYIVSLLIPVETEAPKYTTVSDIPKSKQVVRLQFDN